MQFVQRKAGVWVNRTPASKNSGIPRLLKFNSKGILVYSRQLLGIKVDKALYQEVLNAADSVGECITKNGDNNVRRHSADKSWDKEVILEQSKKYNPLYYYIGANQVAFNDQLEDSYHIYLFDGSRIRPYHIPKDETYKYFYAKTPLDSFYTKYMDDMSMVKVINLCPLYADDSSLLYTASFPKVSVTISEADTALDYYNRAVVVKHDFLKNNKQVAGLNLDSQKPHLDSLFVPIHKESYYYRKDHFLIMPVQKGWPAVGFEQPAADDIEKNPFLPKFYEQAFGFAYSFNNGELHYDGFIPQFYKQHQLGYFAYSPVFAMTDEFLVVADKYTGEIQLYNYESLKKNRTLPSAKVISNAKLEQRISKLALDGFTDKMEYFNAYASQLNNVKSYLSCLTVADGILYTVVIYDSELFLEEYDLKTLKKIKEEPLKININNAGYHLHSLRISKMIDGVKVSMLYKNENSLSLLLKEIE